MKLAHLLNKQITIARMVTESGDKLLFTTVTVEMGHIQPMGNSASEVADGVFSKAFRVYMDGCTDVREGDYLRDQSTGDKFIVKADGVSRRSFGSIDFLIVILEKTR
jgi:hypothetical protein